MHSRNDNRSCKPTYGTGGLQVLMFTPTMNSLRSLNIKGDQNGQALVEMAFAMFLLVLLVFGIIEFGRALYTKNTLTNLARAGVRAAVVTPAMVPADSSCTSLTCPNTNPVLNVVCASMVNGVNPTQVAVTVTDANGNSPAQKNDTIDVSVQLTGYQSLLPRLISMPTTLTGQASMRYE